MMQATTVVADDDKDGSQGFETVAEPEVMTSKVEEAEVTAASPSIDEAVPEEKQLEVAAASVEAPIEENQMVVDEIQISQSVIMSESSNIEENQAEAPVAEAAVSEPLTVESAGAES